ncbi:MAG: hypothetical protein A3G87_06290 [Omnitrophica bacterium RIFCSPLOWO2_12_FULL_50_11]|nr:MAG: hypothetical protein A3G87_06290 [Omnitrophica bacterium RIFCSPLOWO2_12_FULL_50_11]
MGHEQILYFVKYPEPGKVKTRLAKALGSNAAAKAYRGLAESIFHSLSNGNSKSKGFETVVFFDPPEKERQVKEWLPGAAAYRSQKGKDLGERLIHAFKEAFQDGAERVLAVGSDTLGFKPKFVMKAFDVLKNYDVVIGPAKDGGYYLIGFSGFHTILFQDIPWSTGDVLKTTLGWIREEGLSYSLLQELEDLDEINEHTTYGP